MSRKQKCILKKLIYEGRVTVVNGPGKKDFFNSFLKNETVFFTVLYKQKEYNVEIFLESLHSEDNNVVKIVSPFDQISQIVIFYNISKRCGFIEILWYAKRPLFKGLLF